MRTGVQAVLALVVLLCLGTTASSAGTMTIKLKFVNHIQDKLPEQNVFVERVAGFGQVFRPTPADYRTFLDAPLFATAKFQALNPFDEKDIGPYQKGRALGVTLRQWLAASGSGTYTCQKGVGQIRIAFKKLAPNGLYTMWYGFSPAQPMSPLLGIDLPLGALDGSQNTFRADAAGNATYSVRVKPCLQLSGDYLVALLAAAWHSDGKTYGVDPGPFSQATHVHLYMILPNGAP